MTESVPTQRYLNLMSAFPTGVAVVTSVDADGTPRGMTCTSLTSATLVPPTLLVCLRIGSGTLDAVRASGRFAVNLLADGGRQAAEVFAGPERRFERVGWRPSPCGLPWLLEDAFAVAECRVGGVVDIGDHTAVFGQVTGIEQVTGTPLLYGHRRYGALPAPDRGSDDWAHLSTESVGAPMRTGTGRG